ncbi:hypothetical protein AB205_0035040 [Aquarana catesbeiana]|uniref:NIDO domain-containing protein n=1 Tax=Aquarana catesbeiana TaxID=8400 RepID=A0A2G9NQ35_AQUCT|nr:hypothetical protein AB205_0035040 [Aquarana catesbeiana]
MPGPFTTRSTTITSPFTRNTTNTSPFIQSSDLLYPYGSALDIINPKADDGGSPQIFPSRDIPLFGRNYSYLYVNNNGLLSFASSISQFTPQALPVSFGNPFLAIFWADVYNELAGDIYYRESTDPSLLSRATSDIRTYFHAMNFTAQWVFVATWHRVAYFGSSTNKVNTFQAVLSTDGNQTFLLYNYGDIQWPSMNLDGFSLDGPLALAGLNSGYDTGYYTLPGSLTISVANLSSTSNVNVTGRWAFKVDKLHPEDVNGNIGSIAQDRACMSVSIARGIARGLKWGHSTKRRSQKLWRGTPEEKALCCSVQNQCTEQAGLNSGYETGYYTLPGSIAISVANLSSTSNVNVTGRWAFKVDKLHPEDANGNIDNSTENENSTGTPLTTTPGPITTSSTTITSPFARNTTNTSLFIQSSGNKDSSASIQSSVEPRIASIAVNERFAIRALYF